ncbi:MAG: coiled-coil domain-containing protein [Promethearchaeota archaeon]
MPIKKNELEGEKKEEIGNDKKKNNESHISDTKNIILEDKITQPQKNTLFNENNGVKLLEKNIKKNNTKVEGVKFSKVATNQSVPDNSYNRKDMIKKGKLDSDGKSDDLVIVYEDKLKELDEKIENYDKKYQKLTEITQLHENRNQELIEKTKEYEMIIKEYEVKMQTLEKSKSEFETRSENLEEARKQFLDLNKQLEIKRVEFEKREKNLEELRRNLEKQKYDVEKDKIELDNYKLEFKKRKSELEFKSEVKDLKDFNLKLNEKEIKDKKGKELKGKAVFLQKYMNKLCLDELFQSSFLIDSKGMIIAEYNKTNFDIMAIGAMFSLISTSILRTIESLNLNILSYIKLVSANGTFLVKNININNYPRNFILLSYYEKDALKFPKEGQKLKKKIINQILKGLKEDLCEFKGESKISWVFDNLNDKIDFLKKKYTNPEKVLESKRLNLLMKTSIKIKELFETAN